MTCLTYPTGMGQQPSPCQSWDSGFDCPAGPSRRICCRNGLPYTQQTGHIHSSKHLRIRVSRPYFRTFAPKLKVKKLKLKLKKHKTQKNFAQNSKFRQFFQKFKKIFTQILQFLSKIRQNCSKTLEFAQNSR